MSTVKYKGLRVQEIVDLFENPILIYDSEGHLIVANSAATTTLPLCWELKLEEIVEKVKQAFYIKIVEGRDTKLLIVESPFSVGGDFTREFLSSFFHKLENPIAGVYGFLSLMKSGSAESQRDADYLEKALEGLGRIQTLLRSVKPLAVEKTVHPRVMNFSELLSTIERKTRRAPEWKIKGVIPDFKLAENIDFLIYIDAALFSEAFCNFLSFLRDQSTRGDRVIISAQRGEHEDFAMLAVEFPSTISLFPARKGIPFQLPVLGKIVAEHKGGISWRRGEAGRNQIVVQLPIKKQMNRDSARDYHEKKEIT